MHDSKYRTIYRVILKHEKEEITLYCEELFTSDIYGFAELEGLIFSSTDKGRSKVIVNPKEENLLKTFKGVRRTMVPYTSIVRIDEIEHRSEGSLVQREGIKLIRMDGEKNLLRGEEDQ